MYNDIRDDVAQCAVDTARILGQGAANRLNLSPWRSSVAVATRMIKEQIVGENKAHGAKIHWQKGKSLEDIVLDPRYSGLFTVDEIQIARRTLA